MPVMDGFEATKILRESNYTGPIIALTACSNREYRQKAFEIGFNDYITKPIRLNLLKNTIQQYIK